MREICFTDFVHECGNARCAEEALQERSPCFELVGYGTDDDAPTVAALIRQMEEERRCA
jgi:hypothetical protein